MSLRHRLLARPHMRNADHSSADAKLWRLGMKTFLDGLINVCWCSPVTQEHAMVEEALTPQGIGHVGADTWRAAVRQQVQEEEHAVVCG